MPHCIIEFSQPIIDKIEPVQLLKNVYQGALASGLFESLDIKTRAISYAYYMTGADKQDFIHVSLRILNGRTAEQKAMLSSKVLEQLCQLKLRQISLTVEVLDIDRSSYAKHVS